MMMNEVFRLFGRIAIDSNEAEQSLDRTRTKANKLATTMNTAFTKIGRGAAVCGRAMVTGLAAGAAAMGALVVKSLDFAGQLEQNMGGTEKVFGIWAQRMKMYGEDAYKSMGLSQSDYLATANKMGAIFQGMGFDASDSALMTVNAMQRAADVASIMGISTEDAMEAVIGMAKGNFTMMDNLGVAMNDTALQAYALEKGITKSVSSMSTAEKIGLAYQMFMEETAYATGNFRKETNTLAGSLAVAKGAWQNFLSGTLTQTSMDNMVQAFVNVADVVINNLNTLLPKLTKGLTMLIQRLTPYIPQMLQAVLPGLIEGGVMLISALALALPDILEIIIDELPFLMEQLALAAEKVFPVLLETAGLLFSMLAQQLPLWFAGIGQAISAWWNGGQGLLDLLKGAIEWTLPLFGMPETGDAVAKIEAWWNEHIQPHIDVISENLATIGSGMQSIWAMLFPNEIDQVVADAIASAVSFLESISTLIADVTTWATENTELLNILKGALSIFLFLVKPDWAVAAFIITNWNTLVELGDKIIADVDTFFSVTVPEWWKKQWEDIGKWWNDNIVTPINNAIEAIKEFLGLNAQVDNTPTHGQAAGVNMGNSTSSSSGSAHMVDEKAFGMNDMGMNGTGIRGFATGLDFVPRDNYVARLHYGETVLNKEAAAAWRSGHAFGIDYDRLAEAISQHPVAINVDSKTVGVVLAREMSKAIGNRNIQTLMGMGG